MTRTGKRIHGLGQMYQQRKNPTPVIRAFIKRLQMEGNYSDQTIEQYERIVRLFFKYGGTMPVTQASVDAYATYCKDELAPPTRNLNGMVVRLFLKWLGVYDENGDGIYIAVPTVPRTYREERIRQKLITRDEFAAMIEHCVDDRERAILNFLWETGCRASEVCKMTDADVNFELYFATVSGKTGSRVVPFSKVTAALMRSYLNNRYRSPQAEEQNAFWVNLHRKPLNRRALLCWVKDIATRAAVRLDPKKEPKESKVSPHWFRHTSTTEDFRRDIPAAVIQKSKGWTSPAMLQIYLHLNPDDQMKHFRRAYEGEQTKDTKPQPIVKLVECPACKTKLPPSQKVCFCGHRMDKSPTYTELAASVDKLKSTVSKLMHDKLEVQKAREADRTYDPDPEWADEETRRQRAKFESKSNGKPKRKPKRK